GLERACGGAFGPLGGRGRAGGERGRGKQGERGGEKAAEWFHLYPIAWCAGEASRRVGGWSTPVRVSPEPRPNGTCGSCHPVSADTNANRYPRRSQCLAHPRIFVPRSSPSPSLSRPPPD